MVGRWPLTLIHTHSYVRYYTYGYYLIIRNNAKWFEKFAGSNIFRWALTSEKRKKNNPLFMMYCAIFVFIAPICLYSLGEVVKLRAWVLRTSFICRIVWVLSTSHWLCSIRMWQLNTKWETSRKQSLRHWWDKWLFVIFPCPLHLPLLLVVDFVC